VGALGTTLRTVTSGDRVTHPEPRLHLDGAHPSSYPEVQPCNFTTVEEIPAGEEVLAGMYYLHEHPIIILFNSRASHDFVSLACAQKTSLSLEKIEMSYLILTPRG
jgi:hypothetical protein